MPGSRNPTQKAHSRSRETCAQKPTIFMAATDLVPCFYTGQNYRIERPAELHPRHAVREFKRQKLGQFIENGKYFLYFKRVVSKAKQLWDGLLGTGNALPFSLQTDGDRLHYEIPMANDLGMRRHGLYRQSSEDGKSSFLLRHRIKVSARKIDFTAAAFRSRTRVLTNSNQSASSLIQANA